MPAGLQVWDASGANLVDTGSRLGRLFGRLVVSGPGSLVDPRFTTGTPFVITLDPVVNIFITDWITTFTYSFSGATLSWNYISHTASPSLRFYYGAF